MNMSRFHTFSAAIAGMLVLPIGFALADDDERETTQQRRVVVVRGDDDAQKGVEQVEENRVAIATVVVVDDDGEAREEQDVTISKDGRIVIVRGHKGDETHRILRVRPHVIESGSVEARLHLEVVDDDGDESPGNHRVRVRVVGEDEEERVVERVEQRILRRVDGDGNVRVIRLQGDDDDDESSPGDRVRRIRVRHAGGEEVDEEVEIDDEGRHVQSRIIRLHAHDDDDDSNEHRRVIILRTSRDGEEDVQRLAIPMLLHGDKEGLHQLLIDRVHGLELHGHPEVGRLIQRLHWHEADDDDDGDEELEERIEELEERIEALEDRIRALTRRRR